MAQIGIGVIGCGGRIRGVIESIMQATKEVRVVAVYDPDPRAIGAIREQFNPDAAEYADVQALVADPAVQWVFIGSWNCFHAEQAIAAFAAGKHVFCEKPLATSLEDCLAMREAWLASGVSFVIGFTLRYSPHYRRINELLQQDAIGELISMEFNETLDWNHGGYIHSNWRRFTANAGTHLLEKCCHDIDIVNWMVGSRAQRVASFGGCDFFTPRHVHQMTRLGKNSEGRQGFLLWEDSDVDPFTAEKDIVDNQVAIIEYANGVRATFHTNCCSGIPERRLYLIGTEGAIRADVMVGKIEVKRYGFDTELHDVSTSACGGHGDGDVTLGQELAELMLHGTPPRTTLQDGLAAAVTCFAIDEAQRSGTVVDVQPWWDRVDRGVIAEVAG